MTMEREKALLTSIREMAQMSSTDIAQRFQVPVENAGDYFRTKTMSIIDTIIDDLDVYIAEDRAKPAAAAG